MGELVGLLVNTQMGGNSIAVCRVEMGGHTLRNVKQVYVLWFPVCAARGGIRICTIRRSRHMLTR